MTEDFFKMDEAERRDLVANANLRIFRPTNDPKAAEALLEQLKLTDAEIAMVRQKTTG